MRVIGPTIIGAVTSDAPAGGPASDEAAAGIDRPRGLAGLTPSGRARVPVAWSLYDFANTIFSYAVVSTGIGLWLTDDSRFGQGPGKLVQGLAIAVSVGLNALVSPILALSDRGGRRLLFLLFFTVLTIVPTVYRSVAPTRRGPVHDRELAYQAALSFMTTLSSVSFPATRGKLGDRRRRRPHGHVFAAVTLILLGITETPDPIFFIAGVLSSRSAVLMFLSSCDPAWPEGHARPARRHHLVARPDPGHDRPRPNRARSAPVPPGAVLLQRRGQHAHRRDERRSSAGGRPDPGPVADHVGRADGRRHRRELRLGLSRRPVRPEEDAHRGPRVVGRRPAAGRRVARTEWHDTGSRLVTRARSSAAAWAASRSPTGSGSPPARLRDLRAVRARQGLRSSPALSWRYPLRVLRPPGNASPS